MCVIAYIPQGAPVPSMSRFHDCWRANADGAGFMYPHNNTLVITKGLMSFTAFKEAWKAAHADLVDDNGDHPIAKCPICVHFRIGTHGGHIPEMTHPHRIGSEVNHLALAHNGIIRSFCSNAPGAKSDSAYFADFLAGMPNRWWEFPTIIELAEDKIGNANKVVIFDRRGLACILNKKQGYEIDGVWYSNAHWQRTFAKTAVFNTYTYSPTEPLSAAAERLLPATYKGTLKLAPDGHDIQKDDEYFIVDAWVEAGSCRVSCQIDNGRIKRVIRVLPDRLQKLLDKRKLIPTLQKPRTMASYIAQAQKNLDDMNNLVLKHETLEVG